MQKKGTETDGTTEDRNDERDEGNSPQDLRRHGQGKMHFSGPNWRHSDYCACNDEGASPQVKIEGANWKMKWRDLYKCPRSHREGS